MIGKKSFLVTVLVAAVFITGLAIQSAALAKKAELALDIPQAELQTFTEVYQRIKLQYVDEVEGKTLISNAIKGMLEGLDPHSTYLDSEEYQDLKIGTTGEFGGLGIEVTMENGFVKVVSPIDDTPAERAGIESGDVIIRLNDTPVKGMNLKQAVDVMRGKPGTDILLTVVREGEDRPRKITITRDIIKVHSVKSRFLEPGYGYVRVTQFQSRTADDVQRELKKLTQKDPLKGIVLDLRNNPGGLLQAAVGVSDIFLNAGTIVSIKGRAETDKIEYVAERGDVLNGAPVVVLINGGSASASEIVSGALQDHSRAVIMGSKSFGKGSVQTINELNQGDAVKLTTARYYTPNGRSIQAEGIEPDIKLDRVKVEVMQSDDFSPIAEVNLKGHLENDGGDTADKEPDTDTNESNASAEPLAQRDYQLFQALTLLKGLHVLQAKLN